MAEMMQANGVTFYQDWERYDGSVCMVKPKTTSRYYELKEQRPDMKEFGIFFAFNKEQFRDGKRDLVNRGYLKENELLCDAGMGLYGTRAELDRYTAAIAEREKLIAAECNPQEVYFSEWNNHECMISCSDDAAMEIIIDVFGKEAAHKIYRIYPDTPTNILAPLTERDEHLKKFDFSLRMLGRLKSDCGGFFNEDDCRHHRLDSLWGTTVQSQVAEMRKRYRELPDDIKDASPMTISQIEDYARRLEEWAYEEFGKPEYDPVPRTERKDLPKEIFVEHKLYYKDDDGMWQTPGHIWFSCDLRRFKQDEREVHGRAMTTYHGKNGTTLTPVYILDPDAVCSYPYRRDDLCDVTCYYDYKPGNGLLHDFYYE